MNTAYSAERKRKPDQDPSYQPPKSTKRKANSYLSTSKSSRGYNSDHADGLGSEFAKESCREHPKETTASTASTAREAIKESTETLGTASVSSESEKPHLQALAEATPERASPPATSAETILVTPTKPIEDEPSSPKTEEVYRKKIPVSLECITSFPPSTPDPYSAETPPITILQAVQIIHQFSKYQDAAPRHVHARILQSLRDRPEAVAGSLCGQWSDGSMWMQVLERGSSENNKVTIFNMLEYMGAWEWYNSQIELAQATICTKKNKPVDRRGAAIHVLNRMQNMQMDATGQGSWISGVGRVKLEEDKSDVLLTKGGKANITEQAEQARRKRISVQLSRGQKLSTKLVKVLGLGILFSPKIW